MSQNQATKLLVAELVKKHPMPAECFKEVIKQIPEEKEFLLRVAKALKVKISD